ncbi:MAG: cytochrome c3 family protein [Spirochaetota bacterium]
MNQKKYTSTMKKLIGLPSLRVSFIVLALVVAGPAFAQAASATAGKQDNPADTCLDCHGPFESLVNATKAYKWPSGDLVSPHQYEPHTSKDIIDCTNCHKPHPLPPSESDIKAMADPDPSFCYSCHHTGVLTCGTCH